jgi:hypothetical protein
MWLSGRSLSAARFLGARRSCGLGQRLHTVQQMLRPGQRVAKSAWKGAHNSVDQQSQPTTTQRRPVGTRRDLRQQNQRLVAVIGEKGHVGADKWGHSARVREREGLAHARGLR